MNSFNSIADDVCLGKDVSLARYVNLYGCFIGDNTKIGSFVEIQKNVTIGNNCKISSHTFICSGVDIDDNCFVGHAVVFINDKWPRSVNEEGSLESSEDWKSRFVRTRIGKAASIGSNVTIMGGVTIGNGALIGAGSVVTRSVPAGEIWTGNPARRHKQA